MKNIFPALILIVFLFLPACSGKDKNKNSLAYLTMEERYPGWTNLTWISTDMDTGAFPRIEIMIRENVATVRQHTSDSEFVSREYTTLFFFGNILTFADKAKANLTASYSQTDSTVMIRTIGLLEYYPGNTHTYLLRKNRGN